MSQEAVSLDDDDFILRSSCFAAGQQHKKQQGECRGGGSLPSTMNRSLAIVMGNEATGCTEEMLLAADHRVYLPIHGFADSLNLSVAAAMVLQKVFMLFPQAVGCMSEDEREQLRKLWYSKLSRSEAQKGEFLKLAENPPLRK